MCPFTSSDGHNFPRLVEESDPGVAAMVEDIGLQGEPRSEALVSRKERRMKNVGLPEDQQMTEVCMDQSGFSR